jgi:hypothetical protein
MKAPKERRFNIGDEDFTRLLPENCKEAYENCKGVMPRCIYIIYVRAVFTSFIA